MEDTPPIVIHMKRILTPTGQKAVQINVDNLIYSHWTKKQEGNTLTYKNRMGCGEITIKANLREIYIDNQTLYPIQFCDCDSYGYRENVSPKESLSGIFCLPGISFLKNTFVLFFTFFQKKGI